MEQRDVAGYAELLSDPDTHAFITDFGPVPESEVPARIRRNLESSRSRHHLYWSLEYSSQFVGYVALHSPRQPSPALSYAIRAAWRRQGLAREAVEAVCDYARSGLGIHELVASTHHDNRASAALLLGLGFREMPSVEIPVGPRRKFKLSAPTRR